MPKSLEEVRQKYPRANHPPREGCKYCDGTGDKRRSPTVRPGVPCICIFVSHDLCDFAAESLAETVRKIREEMK